MIFNASRPHLTYDCFEDLLSLTINHECLQIGDFTHLLISGQ